MTEEQKPTQLDVEFKGQTANDGKAGIGFKVGVNYDELPIYARLLVGAELKAKLAFCPSKHADADGQQKMDGADITVDATAECKGFSVRADMLSAKLTFNESSIDVGKLAHLAGKRGSLILTRVGDLKPAEKEGAAE